MTPAAADASLWALLAGPFLEFGFMRRALAGCVALSLSCPKAATVPE